MYSDVRTFAKSAAALSAFRCSCTKSISFGKFSRISSPSHVNSKSGNQRLIQPICVRFIKEPVDKPLVQLTQCHFDHLHVNLTKLGQVRMLQLRTVSGPPE